MNEKNIINNPHLKRYGKNMLELFLGYSSQKIGDFNWGIDLGDVIKLKRISEKI